MSEHSSADGSPSPNEPAVGFTAQESWIGRVLVLSVHDAVDALSAPLLTAAIGTAFTKAPAALIVDLSAVDFFASAGMNVLVAAQKEYGTSNRFAVVADGPATSRPIKLLGIDRYFAMYPTLEEAVRGIDG